MLKRKIKLIQHLNLPSPLEKLNLKERPDLQFYIKRDDLIHSSISGNKYRKLQGILKNYNTTYSCIITFGGAFSNHLVATAAISNILQIPSYAYVRTDHIDRNNPTLKFCEQLGMSLHAMDRDQYKRKEENEILSAIRSQHPNALIIAEGGSSEFSSIGMKEMLNEIHSQLKKSVDYFVCSLGTGATASGILEHINENAHLTICPAIKGLTKNAFYDIQSNLGLSKKNNFSLTYTLDQKSYAKKDIKLFRFIEDFYVKYDVLLDPIYTGKAMYAILQDPEIISKNKTVVFIHTGGIQAWKGYFYRFPTLIDELPTIYQSLIQ